MKSGEKKPKYSDTNKFFFLAEKEKAQRVLTD